VKKGDGTQTEDSYLSTAPAYSFSMPLAHLSKNQQGHKILQLQARTGKYGNTVLIQVKRTDASASTTFTSYSGSALWRTKICK
jgi:hypothetical protein